MNKIEIVAECGINHGGDMRLAKEMIRIAKVNGADIAKFQLYDVDAMFPDKKIIAQRRNWYEEVKKTQLSRKQVSELADYCRRLGIEFLCSAFDIERLSWLEEIGVKRHKIATRMNKAPKYVEEVIRTRKEVLISCSCKEIEYVKMWQPHIGYNIKYERIPNVKFLYCVPEYPTPFSNCKLQYVDFGHHFSGFSDHTISIEASMIAMARGASIIEKHFCLKRDGSNPDMVCSIEPHELKQLAQFARKVEEVL